jgi:hypothetical protein
MKNGPLIFLGGLVAMISCWCGLVVAPVLGLGSLAANVDGTTGDIYPVDRAGAAKQGAQLYRSLGCGECHTRHTTQESLLYGTRITEVAADKEAVMATLLKLRTDWTEKEASDALGTPPPIQVLASVDEFSAARAVDLLKATESKAEMTVHNSGTDLARGWGKRQSVSRDYIYDADILLGSRRIGPDLANIGSRAPESHVGEMNLYAPATNLVERLEERRQWHLRRLYSPVSTLEGAKCPSYKFLFDVTDEAPNGPNAAVTLPEKFAAPVGKFVVPKIEAAQLVAWLLAQSADISLPEAPVQKPDAPVRKDPKTEADAAADQSK